MEYAALVEVYEQLDATSSTLEKTTILADLFRQADGEYLPILVKLSRGKLYAAWESKELGVSTSLTKEAINKSTGISNEQLEDWWRETGDLGSAAAEAVSARTQTTLVSDTLDVRKVHDTLQELPTFGGEGSQQRRIDAIAKLLSNASPGEARYIVRTVVGAMRLGVGEGIVRDAIAEAFLNGTDEDVEAVERAHQVTNDYPLVAETARNEGVAGLNALDIQLFRPIKVMLAQKAEDISDGRENVAPTPADVLTEIKYDGIRTQIHTDGERIEVYTRRLENVTTQFPEIVDAVEANLADESFIIEGEIVGYDPESGRPVPFQDLSQRVKRKYDIEQLREEIPVKVHLFDMLSHDGESLLETPLRERLGRLDGILAGDSDVMTRAQNLSGASKTEIDAFYTDARRNGHEGVMLKNLAAAYQPGSRVGYMMKLKPTMEPLDLVVPRAKWSEGRKSDFLGRVYLACRDPETGEFLEVGRMATGFTDSELQEITQRLEPLIQKQSGREVIVEPEVVLEVEYEEIQESPEYESGYALRFPRFKQFRDDVGPDGIDTIDRVEALYSDQ